MKRRSTYCKADQCTAEVEYWQLMCREHWYRVSPATRARVHDRRKQLHIARTVHSPWVRERIQQYRDAVNQAIREAA